MLNKTVLIKNSLHGILMMESKLVHSMKILATRLHFLNKHLLLQARESLVRANTLEQQESFCFQPPGPQLIMFTDKSPITPA